MNHPCPHHCPSGAAPAGLGTAVAIVTGTVIISNASGPLTTLAVAALVIIAVLAIAGVIALVLILRSWPGRSDRLSVPRTHAPARPRVVESPARQPARVLALSVRQNLPAGRVGLRSGMPDSQTVLADREPSG